MFSMNRDWMIHFFKICFKIIYFYKNCYSVKTILERKIAVGFIFSCILSNSGTFKATQTLTHEISGNGLYSQKLPFTKNKTIRNKHQNLHLNMNMRQILNIKDVVVLVFNGFYRDEKKNK